MMLVSYTYELLLLLSQGAALKDEQHQHSMLASMPLRVHHECLAKQHTWLQLHVSFRFDTKQATLPASQESSSNAATVMCAPWQIQALMMSYHMTISMSCCC